MPTYVLYHNIVASCASKTCKEACLAMISSMGLSQKAGQLYKAVRPHSANTLQALNNRFSKCSTAGKQAFGRLAACGASSAWGQAHLSLDVRGSVSQKDKHAVQEEIWENCGHKELFTNTPRSAVEKPQRDHIVEVSKFDLWLRNERSGLHTGLAHV